VIGAPGSSLWLLGHELRLWRRGLGRRGAGGKAAVWIATAAIAVLMLAAGVPLGFALRQFEPKVTPEAVVFSLAALAAIFALMLSQTLAAATDALYQRGDLDLLFSSPLDPRRVLAVRFLAVALQVFLAFAGFLSAFLIPVAVIGHPPWLAGLAVLAALALAATALGLILAMGLFALIGPRRTRAVAQVLAALIGAAFFLIVQARNLLGASRAGGVMADVVRAAEDPRLALPPLADWPLRAAMGEPVPLAAILGVCIGLFVLTSARLGRRFADNAAAAAGMERGAARARGRPPGAFAQGAFAATLRKELRLLRRDPAMLSQVLLRVLYLLPLALVLIRGTNGHVSTAVTGGAAALCFMSGQVSGSLTWITVSAEDAPDLISSAPTKISTIRTAKLSAALIVLAILLAPLLAVLTVLAPYAGVAAIAGCAASSVASGLIVIWFQPPGRRSDFRRMRSGSWVISVAEMTVQGLIAVTTSLAVAGSPWALVPAVLAAAALLALRRSDAQIAEVWRAAVS
jgi:ABC-2 type transport system permease protein